MVVSRQTGESDAHKGVRPSALGSAGMARDLPTETEALHGPDRSPLHCASSSSSAPPPSRGRDGLLARARQAAPPSPRRRELTFLSWNRFVPASDDELRKQAEAFGKANNCTVRVDTMAHLQMSNWVCMFTVVYSFVVLLRRPRTIAATAWVIWPDRSEDP